MGADGLLRDGPEIRFPNIVVDLLQTRLEIVSGQAKGLSHQQNALTIEES